MYKEHRREKIKLISYLPQLENWLLIPKTKTFQEEENISKIIQRFKKILKNQ